MNTYNISYVDNEDGEKKSVKRECYSYGSARVSFKKEFKGKYRKGSISILSLGKVTADQVSVESESNASFDGQKATSAKTILNQKINQNVDRNNNNLSR